MQVIVGGDSIPDTCWARMNANTLTSGSEVRQLSAHGPYDFTHKMVGLSKANEEGSCYDKFCGKVPGAISYGE